MYAQCATRVCGSLLHAWQMPPARHDACSHADTTRCHNGINSQPASTHDAHVSATILQRMPAHVVLACTYLSPRHTLAVPLWHRVPRALPACQKGRLQNSTGCSALSVLFLPRNPAISHTRRTGHRLHGAVTVVGCAMLTATVPVTGHEAW